MDRKAMIGCAYLIEIFFSIVVMTIGTMAMLGLNDLDLTRMSNPWGLMTVMLGAEGLILAALHDHLSRIQEIERTLESKYPDSAKETGQESN